MKYALFAMLAIGLIAVSAVDTDAQRRGNRAQRANPFNDFHKVERLALEKPAPRMHLEDEEGVEHDLDEFLGQWVFIEFGSYT